MIKKLALILFLSLTLFPALSDPAMAANESKIHFIIGGADNVPQCKGALQKCLKDDFNMVVVSGATQDRLEKLYNAFALFSASSKYHQMLKSSGPTKVTYDSGVGCSASVQSNGDGTSTMNLNSFESCPSAELKDRLLHESGHIIRNGYMRLFQRYESEAYYPKDSNCFKRDSFFSPSYFIKTYSTDYAKSQNKHVSGSNESMAESMALYRLPEQELSNFKNQCPTGYNWVKANIFGGYEYK